MFSVSPEFYADFIYGYYSLCNDNDKNKRKSYDTMELVKNNKKAD